MGFAVVGVREICLPRTAELGPQGESVGDGFAEKKRWHQNERDWTRDGRYAILLL